MEVMISCILAMFSILPVQWKPKIYMHELSFVMTCQSSLGSHILIILCEVMSYYMQGTIITEENKTHRVSKTCSMLLFLNQMLIIDALHSSL